MPEIQTVGDRMAEGISVIANLFTIAASALALWIFLVKRKQISAVLKLLLNYSMQISLRELNNKLDELNGLRVADHYDEIVNIFYDIFGQIRGNTKLHAQLESFLGKAEQQVSFKKMFSEAKKRALVSEIREKLRYIDIVNFDEKLPGVDDE